MQAVFISLLSTNASFSFSHSQVLSPPINFKGKTKLCLFVCTGLFCLFDGFFAFLLFFVSFVGF